MTEKQLDYIHVQLRLDVERVNNLIITAIEGGINYWCSGITLSDPKGKAQRYNHKTAARMVQDGMTLKVTIAAERGDPRSGEEHTLDFSDRTWLRDKIQRFHDVAKRHFSEWVAENDDATTADVFVQICCFGEVIYG